MPSDCFFPARKSKDFYGLGHAHIDAEDAKFQAVTLAQVKAAAQKYLRPDALVISVVQPEKP